MKNILAKLLGISKAVLDFYTPILKAIFVSGVSALLPIALDIVRQLATAQIDKDEKRDLAINRLKEAAVAQGIEATESLIRLTVESAVARMKAGA